MATTTGKKEIRYEDAAEMRTGISGWCCKTCNRFWGDDEHMARYCCATSQPCECGGRITPRSYTICDACRKKKRDARWEALEKVDWDGETPLCEWDGDRYYFDEDSVRDAVAEHLHGGGRVEDFRLAMCRPVEPRAFEMAEFLSDSLPEDFDTDGEFDEIDGVVNDWIRARGVLAWEPTGEAVKASSLPMPDPEDD